MHYVLVKRGNYRHEIIAVDDTLARAVEAAEAWLREENEHDRYHHVEVVPVGPDGERTDSVVCVYWAKGGGILSGTRDDYQRQSD